jgi:glutathione S-transferase
MLFLYHAPMSPCVQKVRLVLEEKALPWQGQLFDLQAKEQLNPAYLAINPAGLVPALAVDGQIITESTIICEFLDDAFPARQLSPADPLSRARMRGWLKRVDEVLHPNTGALVFSAFVRNRFLGLSPDALNVLLAKVPDPARRERQSRLIALGLDAPDVAVSLTAFARIFAQANSVLESQSWLAGDQISLADLAVAPYAYVIWYLGIEQAFVAWPNLARWFERIMQRPSFDAAVLAYLSAEESAQIRSAAASIGPLLSGRLADLLDALEHRAIA